MKKLRNPDNYPTRYVLESYGPGWRVVEYSKYGKAIRGEYLIEAKARARIIQLLDMSRDKGGWFIPELPEPG
jgi:hypothetical protein